MFTNDLEEKWVATPDICCLAELALRWPYQSIFKIPYVSLLAQEGKKIMLYMWIDEAMGANGEKFHKIRKVERIDHRLIKQISHLLILREDIEEIEKDHPEYKAKKDLLPTENPLFFTTEDNLPNVLPVLMWVWEKAYYNRDKFSSALIDFHKKYPSEFINKLLLYPDEIFNEVPENLFPNFRLDSKQREMLTILDHAKEFLKLCSIEREYDKYLALIEIDKRFPGLTNKAIAELFPPPSGTTEPESLEKSGYRLRKRAYKYSDISF